MSSIRVFVNETPVDLAVPATVRDAIARASPELAGVLERGAAYVTDGVGRRMDPSGPLAAGAIIRVLAAGPKDAGVSSRPGA